MEKELDKLKDSITLVKAVLMDAEKKQSTTQGLRVWLELLKNVFYDAEDILNDFEVEDLRRQVVSRGDILRKVHRFCSRSNPLIFRTNMSHKLKKLNERLDGIVRKKIDFQLVEGPVNNYRPLFQEEKEKHSFVRASNIIGRDEDKEKIIELLLHPNTDRNINVIPIVGIGGLGKTTLAKLVYNDERIIRHFELKMWVYVSKDFGERKLMENTVKTATGDGQDYGNFTMDQLQIGLRDAIKDKKILLVLDDVWNEDRKKWEELKDLLMVGASGSMIMVTTRSHLVASIMCTTPTYNLLGLRHDECLSLFVRYAFMEGQERQYPNLVKIGDDIVRKCGGVPLAVMTLAGQLFLNTRERDWNVIKDSGIWEIEEKETESGILPALRVSYEQLPSPLKRCFAYCSIFPKDYEFNDFEVVQFWMALGLIVPMNERQELEDVGFRYLEKLGHGFFVQDFRDHYGVVRFRMHDVMHELALSVSKDECSVVTANRQKIAKNVRHLSFPDPDSLPQDLPTILQDLDRVRTVCFQSAKEGPSCKSVIETCLSRFQYLRVLNLSRSQFDQLPKGIGNFKHLRYLDLSWNHKIRKLPSSIYKLQNLQTLILAGCDEIEKLPRNLRYMVSLRFLCITTRQKSLPKGEIGCLKSLRVLWIYSCENVEHLFEDMQALTNLRTLYICTCQSLVSLPPCIKQLTALEILLISGCESLNLARVGGQDDQNSSQFSLRKLVISFVTEMVELPQWLLGKSADTLEYLRVEFCPGLTELPEYLKNFKSLEQLWILGCPLLDERCKLETGEDWPKIAHIPNVNIDSVDIRSTDV
ncbi:putative disease resistance protein RGA3 isoform X2 [Elaeis guineensis]|nr:putative disease resistance protein RGA3 isoform X2 [Elaeis guineensis]